MRMEQRIIIHFLDPSSRLRAELSRIAFALGYHAEVYSDLTELTARELDSGIIVSRDDQVSGGIESLVEKLDRSRVWLPLIALAEQPTISRAVACMKAGALDYLRLPLDLEVFDNSLRKIDREANDMAEARRKMFEARNRISNLSNREREVLDWLARGRSNKAIARELDISPRTVEIHRANMMAKLGASHSADAVRLAIEAQITQPAQYMM